MGPGEISDNRTLFRFGLGSLGGVQALLGLYALICPTSFYEDFPFGRGWVEALPAYNEHLTRDLGGLFLGIGLLLLAAAWWLDRRVALIALVSYLAYSIPHAIFHFFNLEPYETADAIANVITLAATVVVPVALLGLLIRKERQ